MIQINNTQYIHFLQQADVLRRSGLLCDAIISVKSQTFRAHRLVLACASRILAQQLALADIDRPVHCTLEFFSPRTFQQVLDFTYTETLEVTVDDLHLLLRAAQLLEMQPLEDQCQKQLDNLNIRAREENKRNKITHVKKEQERAEHTEQQQRRDSVQEEKLGQSAPSVDEECFNISPADSEKNSNRLPSPRKKPRLPPEPATSFNRESVITRPASSSSSFSSPWMFPPNMWSSVNTLRRIAENYSNLIATHSIQSPNQSSVAHPFSVTNSQMFPLFGTPFPSSVMGYSGFQPRYTQNLYAGSTRMGSIIKQGLVKRKKHGQRACTRTDQSGGPSCHDASRDGTDRVKDCHHCSKSLLGVPVLQEPASTPSGEACAGCKFCGRGVVSQHAQQSHQQEHTGEKPHQCKHCPKKFSLKHQLDTHHRVHTGEKPFECRLCGQRSRDYSAMIKHLRTHGGAAPYQCTVCLEYCSSLVAMQRHIKSHTVQDFPPDWSINSTYLYTSHI